MPEKTEDDTQVPIEIEDSDESGSSRAGTSNNVLFTRDQQFKKEMAELELKRKKQEFREKEQELKALERTQKHEAFMALYGPPKV